MPNCSIFVGLPNFSVVITSPFISVVTYLSISTFVGLPKDKHAPFSPAGPCPNNVSNLKNSSPRFLGSSSFSCSKNDIICANPYFLSVPGILYVNPNILSLKSSNPSFLAISGSSNIDVRSLNISSAVVLLTSSSSSRLARTTSRDLRKV